MSLLSSGFPVFTGFNDNVGLRGVSAPVLKEVVNVSSSGVNLIVTGVASKLIRLMGFYLVSAAPGVTVTWESSGGVLLSGAMPLIAGISACFSPIGLVKDTLPGEGLVLFLGGAVAVGGAIQYVVVA